VDTASAQGGLLRGPAAYVARTPWRPLGALLAAIAVLLIGVVAAALVLPTTLSQAPAPANWPLIRPDAAVLAVLGVWQLTTIALTLLVSALRGGTPRDVLALRPPAGAPLVYGKALLAMVLFQLLVSVVQHSLSEDTFADLRPMQSLLAGREWVLALLVVGVGAPLAEELLFRGFLLSALAASRLGYAGAALVTSALWTALHLGYSGGGLSEVFLVGLFFSWLVWRTGSLRVAIFCHALYNSLIVVVLRYVPLPA
jgi:uncharacterized protein